MAAGQTEVNFAFTAPNAGSSSEFFAFVVTTLLPTNLLALELGQAVCGAAACAPQAQTYAGTMLTVISTSVLHDIGVRLEGDGSYSASAVFRLRRNPDATWELLSVSGESRQSHIELCDLQETITFTELASISESSNGDLSMMLGGPATRARRLSVAVGDCALEADTGVALVPTMTRQPDGRYFFERVLNTSSHFANVTESISIFERAELIPE